MGLIIGLLTFVLVLNCLVLIFLVLIQLPKKEAGAGLAFGGAATDALFGAGSGNVLTKVTKYSATIFFVLAILLAIMQRNYSSRRGSEFQRQLAEPGKTPSGLVAPAASTTPATSTNVPLTTATTAATNLSATLSNAVTAPSAEAPK